MPFSFIPGLQSRVHGVVIIGKQPAFDESLDAHRMEVGLRAASYDR
jgi:hypothetical protein